LRICQYFQDIFLLINDVRLQVHVVNVGWPSLLLAKAAVIVTALLWVMRAQISSCMKWDPCAFRPFKAFRSFSLLKSDSSAGTGSGGRELSQSAAGQEEGRSAHSSAFVGGVAFGIGVVGGFDFAFVFSVVFACTK
jgi:hypothetical protein